MSKYIFNEIFKEIVDTYYIDSNVLGAMIDRDSSRIRHYKLDSKPGKVVLDNLINSIGIMIQEKNDRHLDMVLMERLNTYINGKEIFTDDLRKKLSEIEDIYTYIAFLLRKSREFNSESSIPDAALTTKENKSFLANSIITRVTQAHQYYENNLYQEAISIYDDLITDPRLSEYPNQQQTVYADLGLIYRNNGFSQYDITMIKKSIFYFETASDITLKTKDHLNYALINKYLGTIYTFLYQFEDPENNLKRGIKYNDVSLSAFYDCNNLEEYSKVLINFGVLFIYYSEIRNSRNFLNNAISYLKKAIDYFETNSLPYFKALACKNCSGAYSYLSEIYNTQFNAAQAIDMVQQALKVFTIEDYPIQYAQCVSNLGHIHYTMATNGDVVKNCNKAINYILHSLNIITEEVDTNAYCIAHLNLSVIYTLLCHHSDKQENIKKAIESLEHCRKYYVHQDNSINNMKTNLNYSEVMIALGEENNDLSMILDAETILNNLSALCAKVKFTYYQAYVNYNLAKVYFTYYKKKNQSSYLSVALDKINEALITFTIQDYPLLYANTMHLAAKIYDYIQDYDKSKQAYDNTLRIFTREKYPEKYSEIINEYNELVNTKGYH